MAYLFGKNRTRADLARHSGTLSQFAGVRLVTLENGVERGNRMLQFHTGSGLNFSVLVDRAMDIGEVSHNGRPLGWHSPTGFRNPALHQPEAEDGLSWARSFSGFLATCGLDHTLGPEDVPGDNYNYPRKNTISHGLHGRIGAIPAQLTGYGEDWQGESCTLWAEGLIVQAAVFGEVLHLHRRIEADVGGNEIRLSDRVVNAGFLPTPHMILYHVNLGHPLIDVGSRYVAPIADVIWASHAGASYEQQNAGYRTLTGPQNGFSEQVWEHALAADLNGDVPVAVVNEALGLGLELTTKKSQLPCAFQWQNFQAGNYVMGIEPGTHHVLGDLAARERGEMIWLDALQDRHYDLCFRILDGAEAIKQSEDRITSVARQPQAEFPDLSGDFPKLYGEQT